MTRPPLPRVHRAARAMMLAITVASVAACGSPGEKSPFANIFANLSTLVGKKSPPSKIDAAAVAQALAQSDKPIILIQIEKSGAQSLLQQIATNGRYRTYATGQRQTLTLNDGMITGTRGLGGDLMSSDVAQTQSRLRSGSFGPVTRVQRVLNGENKIDAFVFQCTLTSGESKRVQAGAVDVQTRQVVETCRDGALDVTNSYFVDASGTVIASRQWISPFTGYAVMQQIRE